MYSSADAQRHTANHLRKLVVVDNSKGVSNLMYGFYNMMNYGGFGWLFMLIFWGLVVFAIVELVRYASRSERDSNSKKEKAPLDVLKERYAKGEIGKVEFEEKKKDLQ
ncbi:MAG: hypothetical protein UW65_C0022G0018 [candidate division WWE3 bacterium GW2011_GWB1_44_4]|uniref:SHOCT domain-containing protein n=3 Tax=Katanobacteria TaxID=422282 RepID=A0A0G1HFV0_UNCKA|nr:MAG: hypothetical protein UW36_C0006G0004 [candidate division WWE3 bacterium GW2011_GWA2_44_16]KKT69520.1 MAG: hypothetical protein UW65_C0022G0018 [candidate division WWE3 bacterium GW2011_GWB1_44_4]